MPSETLQYLFELIHEVHGVSHALIVRVVQALRQNLVYYPIVAFKPLALEDRWRELRGLTPVGHNRLRFLQLASSLCKPSYVGLFQRSGYSSCHVQPKKKL